VTPPAWRNPIVGTFKSIVVITFRRIHVNPFFNDRVGDFIDSKRGMAIPVVSI